MNKVQTTVLFKTWTRIPHSYALVARQLITELSRRKDIRVLLEEQPYFNSSWRPTLKPLAAHIATPLSYGDEVDVVYHHSYPYDIEVDSRFPNAKYVVFYTCEFGVLGDSYFTRADGPLLCRAAFVAPSHFSARGIAGSLVIPHGAVVSPQLHPRGTGGILSLGSMTGNKGIDRLTRVHSQYFPKVPLVLKGMDELYQSRQFVGRLPQGNVDYVQGTLSDGEMTALYQSSTVYCSPYLAEGFALTPLEALACGTPIVVPQTGASTQYTEILLEEVPEARDTMIFLIPSQYAKVQGTELIVNHFTDQALAETLEKSLTIVPPDSTRKRVLEAITKHFSWQEVANQYANLFNKI